MSKLILCISDNCERINNCPYDIEQRKYCPGLNKKPESIHKKRWERFWCAFENIDNATLPSKEKDNFREHLLYRKGIIEKELKQ